MAETSPGAHHSAKSNGSLFLETFTLEYFVTIEIIKIQITQADDNGLLVLHETICKLKISTEIDIISWVMSSWLFFFSRPSLTV